MLILSHIIEASHVKVMVMKFYKTEQCLEGAQQSWWGEEHSCKYVSLSPD